MTIWDVVVVGAGLSGLTAAQALRQAGYGVLVLDKSRGVGGRVATRRVGEVPVDHGCRFVQPLANLTSTLIPDGLAGGWLQPWTPLEFDLRDGDRLLPRSPSGPYYIAPSGMNRLAKVLASGLTVQRLCRVLRVDPVAAGWQLHIEPGSEHPSVVTARSLILAMPAPQISPLFAAVAQADAGISAWLDPISQVLFDPVITVMVGYSPETIPTLESLPATAAGWMAFGKDHPHLRWVALDSSKRSNPASPVVVLHSSATFATTHLEVQDLQPVGERLLDLVAATSLGQWLARPTWLQVHRWRYGLVNQPLPMPTLSSPTIPNLVACGDWCGGNGADAAIRSGQAAAAQIGQWLKSRPTG